jgi:hypothetical protein
LAIHSVCHAGVELRKLAGYRFHDSWQPSELCLNPGKKYHVRMNVGDLKTGQRVTFAGFDDVDNHFGIFVFLNAAGEVLEVSGDCSGREHTCLRELRAALSPTGIERGNA